MAKKKKYKYPGRVVPFVPMKRGDEGPAVLGLTRALVHAGFMKQARRQFGPGTSHALNRYQEKHPGTGKPTGRYDHDTHKRMLAEHNYDAYGAWLMRHGVHEDTVDFRKAIVSAALFARAHAPRHYSQDMTLRMEGLLKKIKPPHMWNWGDCSGFATWCYWIGTGGEIDPNGWDFLGYPAHDMYTGSMGRHGTVVGRSAAKPADLVLYGSAPTFHHVAVLVKTNPLMVVSHGHEGGPVYCSADYRGDLTQIRSYL